MISNKILDDSYNSNEELAKQICEYFKSDTLYHECGYVKSIAQAICIVGGNDYGCGYVNSIAQAICIVGGHYDCGYENNIGSAICKIGTSHWVECVNVTTIHEGIEKYNKTQVRNDYLLLENQGDYDWAWDQFYHNSGSLVWACRGIQTGRFAEKKNCYGKIQNDNRWPNK